MRGIVLLFSMLFLVPMLVRAQAKDETQERLNPSKSATSLQRSATEAREQGPRKAR